MAPTQETTDLARLAEVDPDSILDQLNETIARRMPSYEDLYRRWERLSWSVSELDFSRDRHHWLALGADRQDRLLWTLAAFYVAEQRVAATLAPYIASAPLLQQKIFLTTQLVDEARHAVFFDRWFQEVVATGDEDLSRRLRTSRRWLGPGFAPLFDEYLEQVTSRLRADPGDVRAFAKAIAVYHLVVEGVLALTGQKFILAWARNEGVLPGFRAGFTAVARDESRHVAFGARVIRDLLHQDPALIEPIHQGITETLRLGTWLYQPPGGDVTYTSAFGYSLTDLFTYGEMQLEKKMRAIGIPMPAVEIAIPPIVAEWPPPGGGLVPLDARQRISVALSRLIARVAPSVAPGLGMMMLYLGFVPEAARGVRATYRFELHGPGGGTFTVEVDDGDCRVLIGRGAREPDVVYEMDASVWADMTGARATGDEAVLLGKLRIRGNVSLARRFGDFFAAPGEAAVNLASRELGARPPAPVRRLARVLTRSPAA